MRIIGLDLGNSISVCELDKNGSVVKRCVVKSVEELARGILGSSSSPVRVAIEACREAWHVHDVLTAAGHEVVLVDTTRSRQLGIGQHGRKTNRIDAETLARALVENRLPRAHVLSVQRRDLRERVMVRATMIETRSRLTVTVRGVLRAHGVKIRACSPSRFVAHVRAATVDLETRALVEPLCAMLDTCEKRILEIETTLVSVAENEPICHLLMSAPGVSLITALSYISVLDEAKRFRNAHQVESYLGLVPGEYSTGDGRTLGRITKAGNPYLRSTLVQAAWSILLHADAGDPLRCWAEGVATRRGKKVAAIALARRLAGVLWAMWRDGTYYDAQSVERSREKRDPDRQNALRGAAPRVRKQKLARYGAKPQHCTQASEP